MEAEKDKEEDNNEEGIESVDDDGENDEGTDDNHVIDGDASDLEDDFDNDQDENQDDDYHDDDANAAMDFAAINGQVINDDNIVCHGNTSRKCQAWLPEEDAIILKEREIYTRGYATRAATQLMGRDVRSIVTR